MSGPTYPPLTNAVPIDEFVIGQSPVGGFVFPDIGNWEIGSIPVGNGLPLNIWSTIISQYANSPVIDSMITSYSDAMDQSGNVSNFYDMMWNIDTAQGYGLDVWGRIVGVSRILELQTSPYFGFNEGEGIETKGFNQAPFYSGATLNNNYILDDNSYRQLILAKAYSNICDGSTPAINELLLTLFAGLGDCYVTDNGDMTMTYTFTFALNSIQLAIVENSGVLPRSNGVKLLYSIP